MNNTYRELPESGEYVGSEETESEFSPKTLSALAQDLCNTVSVRCELSKVCESPIEIDLGAALIHFVGERYRITPQFKLARFRYDFSVAPLGSSRPIALIECDSRQFHHTKEQLANDLAKDRAAATMGLPVIRVTGPEIYKDPFATARRIVELLP